METTMQFATSGVINGNEFHIPQAAPPRSIYLEMNVTDSDSVREIVERKPGRDRDEYALGALRVGLLSLKHARGQVDVDAVRREGDRILGDLGSTLNSYRSQLTQGVTDVLKDYFDPTSGRFQERVERLIRKDGELEQLLRRQVGSDGSEMALSLARHVGENSPIMNVLDPVRSGGVVDAIRQSAEQVLQAESEQILAEFSLDNKDGAMCRMIAELTQQNGQFTGDLTNKIDEVVKEFSLDKSDSALSRLVGKVESAQRTISNEFSLDNSESALARLKNELVGILTQQNEQNAVFQRDVTSALEAMKARREESLRSTAHGNDFECALIEILSQEIAKAGDILSATGTTTGFIKNCKVGDAVVELGPDCVANGVKFVIEAKESAACDLSKARLEIETARQNRGAAVGLFVFSRKTAPDMQDSILRLGNDVFVIWDADDVASDVILKAAISLAKALCVREGTARREEAADFEKIDKSILAIEKEARRLEEMRKWTETIKSNSGKILEEVRKMADGVEQQVGVLRDAFAGLRS
jgi:hypothetical protein